MAAQAGRNIAFTWGGASVGGVREKSVAINGEPIDITSDENSGWRTLLTIAGQNQVDLTLSGVTKSDALKTDWFGGARTKAVTLTYENGAVISGTFYMASFTDTGPYNGAATFECSLQSSGVVTFTPGTT